MTDPLANPSIHPFSLTPEPIEVLSLTGKLEDDATGAVVTFMGRVRNNNRNRTVLRLEYEGAEDIANNEWGKIAQETARHFSISCLSASHRVGTLEVGEIAVWIGVASPHRSTAFDACRHLIDELKLRLPIWKKEYYADGESEWLQGE